MGRQEGRQKKRERRVYGDQPMIAAAQNAGFGDKKNAGPYGPAFLKNLMSQCSFSAQGQVSGNSQNQNSPFRFNKRVPHAIHKASHISPLKRVIPMTEAIVLIMTAVYNILPSRASKTPSQKP